MSALTIDHAPNTLECGEYIVHGVLVGKQDNLAVLEEFNTLDEALEYVKDHLENEE